MTHEAMARALFENVWNRRDFETAEVLLAERIQLHIGATSRTTTVGELRDIVDTWHEGFSDFRFDIHSVVSSGDRAAVHATLEGTHDGPWGGLDPTGRTIAVEHMFFLGFEDGRIAEVWELLDRAELHSQLSGP